MRRSLCILAALAFLACPAMADTVLPGLIQEALPVTIALPDGRHVKLEGEVTRPDRPGRFPLVVIVHGTPQTKSGSFLETYRAVSPVLFAKAAWAFARRGYAAVTIMRRGFGRSDGPYAEFVDGPCDSMDFLRVARISAEDVTGAVAALRDQPWVDPDRVLLLGYSTGGLAVTAAGAANPAGVVGILDFAGGRGAFPPDRVCSPDRLVDAFETLGRTARIPAAWIFAENDHSFGVSLAKRMFDAYTRGGAPARLHLMPPFGDDGHLLLTAGPTKLWWPTVEAFLASLHLPTAVTLDFPSLPALAPPKVNAACGALFRDYAAARTDAKAFAVNPEGHCGMTFTARSQDDAKDEAMKLCRARGAGCALYAVGHALVHG